MSFSHQLATGAAMAVAAALLPALLPTLARAEPADPGSLVIERDIGPQIAYRGLPRVDYPIGVQVPAFPTSPFNTAMTAVMGATDAELGVHGSIGLVGGAVQAGINPMMSALVGSGRSGGALNSNSIGSALGSGGGGGVASLGTLVPSVLNSAMSPLTSGAIK